MHDSWKRIHSHLLLSSLGGPGNFQLGLPQSVPPQYNTLKDCSPDVLSVRLRVLYNFSDLMYKSWRLLNLDPKNPVISDPFFSGILNISKDQIINDWLSTLSLPHYYSFIVMLHLLPPHFILCPSLYPGVHFTLQFRYDRHHPRWAQRPSITKGQHSASSALHWQNNDPGQNIWATDHGETDFHKVRMTVIFRYSDSVCAQGISWWKNRSWPNQIPVPCFKVASRAYLQNCRTPWLFLLQVSFFNIFWI